MSTERGFLQRRLAQKQDELAAIEEDLNTCQDRKGQLKFNNSPDNFELVGIQVEVEQCRRMTGVKGCRGKLSIA